MNRVKNYISSMIKLAKTFIKASGMSKATDKGQKIKIAILSIFSVFGIILPVIIAVGVVVKIMTENLKPIGCETFGLQLMLYITCLFTIVFGINVLFSELYFANDIEHILPWPLRASQIVGAKFIAVFYMENIMQFALVISCIVGYGIGSHMGIGRWVIALLGVLILPIMSLAYCGIISIIVMGITKLVRNRDTIQRLSIVLLFGLLLVLVASIGSMQTFDLGEAIETMATGNKTTFSILNIIFPSVLWYIKAVGEGNIGAFIVYVLINILAVVFMLIVAELLYFRGVIGLNSASNSRKVKELASLIDKSKQHSMGYAYFMKELRTLLRTPVYFTNCIGTNFVWPIFVYAIYKIKGCSYTLLELQQMYKNNDNNMQLFILLGVIGVSVIITALDSISSNSISREGKHFSFMKYIPVPYRTQWNIKAVIGAIFPAIGVLIFFIPGCILIKVPILHIAIYSLISMMAILFVSYMGIYIDSIQPKLIWEDELNSLRENYNTFFAMAIAIAYVGIVCLGGYFILKDVSIWIHRLIIFSIIIVSTVVVMLVTPRLGARYIEEQEEA